MVGTRRAQRGDVRATLNLKRIRSDRTNLRGYGSVWLHSGMRSGRGRTVMASRCRIGWFNGTERDRIFRLLRQGAAAVVPAGRMTAEICWNTWPSTRGYRGLTSWFAAGTGECCGDFSQRDLRTLTLRTDLSDMADQRR